MAAVARVDLRSAYAHELVVEALDACGWRCKLADAVPGDGPLSMSWADFAAQDWDGVLEGRVVGSAHYLKSGLVRKASLHFYLARHATRERQRAMNAAAGVESAAAGASTGGAGDAGDEGPMPLSVVGDFETRDDDELDEFISAWRAVAATSGVSLWVLKPSEGNRSEGLAIVSIDDADAVRRLVRARDEFATWMLQRHVQPMLAAPCGGKSHDRKFHARAHVIAVGSISVWVHRAPLVLLAASTWTNPRTPLSADGAADGVLAHVTNRSLIRRRASGTDRVDESIDALTQTLDEALGADLARNVETQVLDLPTISHEHSSAATGAIPAAPPQVRALAARAFAPFARGSAAYLPLPNCFEIYGVDVAVDTDGGHSIVIIIIVVVVVVALSSSHLQPISEATHP